MTSDLVYVGPFFQPIAYVVCFISLILSLVLVFLPRYRDNMLERFGATLVAFGAVAVWYHMIDGFFIPRAFWAWGWGVAMVIIGMLVKLPKKRQEL